MPSSLHTVLSQAGHRRSENSDMCECPLSMDDELKKACTDARDKSYSPYSKFRVGAAILLSDGTIIQGANVENASYPAGICAERSAIVTAMMTRSTPLEISAVAVTSDTDDVVSPCGICRQFIREFATNDTPIYMWTAKHELTKMTLGELLPLSFGPDNLLHRG